MDEALAVGQLHDTVVEGLGRHIVLGALAAGSVISADDVSEQFHVSRSVVREAVRVLESMGLLTVKRRVGITVQPPQHWAPFEPRVIRWRLTGPDRAQQLQSLGELRRAVEPLAARLAARRASPEQCGELTGAVIGMSATSRAANAQAYLDHDIRFHRTLLAASGNEMLAGMHGMVAEVLIGRTRHGLMPTTAEPEAIRLHGLVASAVQSGDGDGADRAMQGIVAEAADAIHAVADPAA